MRIMDHPYNKAKDNKKVIGKIEKANPFLVLRKMVWIPNAKEEKPKNNEENIFTLEVLTPDGTKGFISLHFRDLTLFQKANLTT